ncbi:MAG: DUF1801 domain-containing protein [Deltaproteobacteria bacterium]|nr:DUF1801 domain-containing protein [Deltaproteobacteria bacterium]
MAARRSTKTKKTKAPSTSTKKGSKSARRATAARPAAKAQRTPTSRTSSATPKLLSGGNPQIAKGEGDAPVQAYLAALPGWKSVVARTLDALIVRAVPQVKKAVKWNSPFYGIEGQGWFLGVHAYAKYLKVAFFRGSMLTPPPPGESKSKEVRYLDLHEGAPLDEAQLMRWLQQAAALPGWMG